MKLVIYGKVPSKKNSRNIFSRGGKIFNLPGKTYQLWHHEALQQLMAQKKLLPKDPIQKCRVEIRIVAADRRKADLTNKAESIMDFLVDTGVLADDNWVVVPGIAISFGGVEASQPRAEIEIIILL